MRDFEILEHLGLWEDKIPVERAPPDLIREKSCEPYDDGRSLLLVAYLAAVRGAVCYYPLSLNIKIVISGRRIGMRFCRDFEWFMNGILLINRVLC
jgi:hypothetical protein